MTDSLPTAGTDSSNEHLLAELRTITRALLSASLQASFREAEEARGRTVPEAQGRYLKREVLEAFASARTDIADRYLEGIDARFEIDTTGQQDTLILASLEADPEDTEVSAALRHICAQAQGMHKEVLTHLEVRLDELSRQMGRRVDKYSLHPTALCQLFREQIASLAVPTQGRITLCELFVEHLGERLEDLYRRANRILIEGGILADPDAMQEAAANRNVVVRHPACEWTNDEVLRDLRTTSFLAPIDPDEWKKAAAAVSLKDHHGISMPLLLEDDVAPVTAPPGLDAAESGQAGLPGSRQALVGALSGLQHVVSLKDKPLSTRQLKEVICEKLGLGEETNALGKFDEQANKIIDLVSEAYQTSISDESLPQATLALMVMLQIPVIKLALIDSSFLYDPEHPARLLLNEIASMSVGIGSTDETLFRDLRGVIDKLVENFDNDAEVFHKALIEGRRTALIENKRAEAIEARGKIVAEHKARRSAAKRIVVGTLNSHLRKRSVPPQVLQFILKCWAPYMALTYLKEGPESQSWRWSSQVLRRVIEGSQPDVGKAEFDHLIGKVERFFDDVIETLDQVSFQKNDHTLLVADAYDWFQRTATVLLHRDTPSESDHTIQIRLESEENDTAADVVDDSKDLIRMLLECVPQEVTPGAWFEIFQGKGRGKRRLKVSTILEDTGHVLFADRTGHVVLHVHLESFLQDLRTGRSKLINDNKLFDRALNTVIDNIQTNNRRQTA